MRLRRLHIDGFGNLRDVTITLSDGLNLIIGPNEAGKSTVRDFVRALFYGFASRRGDENRRERREPMGGGPYGGWADIIAPGGEEIRMERRQHAQRTSGALAIRRGNGEEAGEEFLEEILGGVTRDYFSRVHAFGLNELANKDKLESVEDSLFGASSRQDPARLKQTRDDLDARMQKLLTVRKKGEIDGLLAKLEVVREGTRELRANAGRIHGLVAEQGKLSERIGRLDETLGDLRALRKAVEAVRDARKARDETIRRRKDVSIDERLMDASARIEELDESGPDMLHLQKESEQFAEQLARHDEKLARGMQKLGDEWNEKRLRALEDPEALEETAREFEAEFEEVSQDVDRAQSARREEQARLDGMQTSGASWMRIVGIVARVLLIVAFPVGGVAGFLQRDWQTGLIVVGVLVLIGVILLLLLRRAAGGKDLHTAERRLQVAETRVEESQTQYAGLNRRWMGWLGEHDLPENLEPDPAQEIIRRAGGLKQTLEERTDLSQRQEKARKEIKIYEAEVRALAAAVGREVPQSSKDLIALPGRLAEELVRTRAAGESADKLDKEIVERQQEIDGVATALVAARAARPQPATDSPTHSSADSPNDDIDAEYESIEEEETALTAERSELLREDGKLGRRIEELRASDELARLRREEEGIVSEVRQLAQEWSAAAAAKWLVDEATKHFQEVHQPAVMRRASDTFRMITDGAFERVMRPVEGGVGSLICVRANGEELRPETLSRGTTEQLYLALRFAAVQCVQEDRPRLPVVMDDVLVNFDAPRAAKAVEAISDLAETHQVLYFTCHSHIASLLESAPGAKVSRLGGLTADSRS